MEDLIGYDEIIENSMRTVIRDALKKIETKGLPGNHYFIITFLTSYAGVNIGKHLKEKHPEEMTIIIQFQFNDLIVGDDKFSISLSFAGKPEKLEVPYKAITSFVDPSINFGLRFSVNYDELDMDDASYDLNPHANKNEEKGKKSTSIDFSSKVVSLDAFRKNKNKDK